MLSSDIIILIGLSFFASGVIKGLTGIGFITICISFLVFLVDLKSAISMLFFSSVLSNLVVMRDAGKFIQTFAKFWPLYIMIAPGLALGVSMLVTLDESNLFQCLAVAIFFFCAFMIFRPDFRIPSNIASYLLMPIGLIHGFVAGLTGTQSVPLIPFVLSMKLDIKQTLQALNTTMTAGTILTGIFLYSEKIMTNDLLAISALLVLPTFAGVSLGNFLRSKLSAETFRAAVLFALAGIGLSLTWKSSSEAISTAYFETLQVVKTHIHQSGLQTARRLGSGREALHQIDIIDRSNSEAVASGPPAPGIWAVEVRPGRFAFIEIATSALPHHSGR